MRIQSIVLPCSYGYTFGRIINNVASYVLRVKIGWLYILIYCDTPKV
jgi:hypothetical protein